MIDHIRGTVCSKEPNLVVIECGGVGYACRTSMQTAAAVGAVDEEALLYTRLTVREDEIALYGLPSQRAITSSLPRQRASAPRPHSGSCWN